MEVNDEKLHSFKPKRPFYSTQTIFKFFKKTFRRKTSFFSFQLMMGFPPKVQKNIRHETVNKYFT